MLNGLSAMAAGIYLVAVGYQGNASPLFKLLSEEKEYLRWLVAFMMLYGLAQNDATKDFAKPLMGAAFLGLLVNASQNSTIWSGVQRVLDFFNPSSVSTATQTRS